MKSPEYLHSSLAIKKIKMLRAKKFVTRTLTPKPGSNTTINDLPEEIIAKILEEIPDNETRNFRLISSHFNSTITAWFGTTLNYSNGSRLPQSLWQGHITILNLKDYASLNPRKLPPLPRLRELEIEGEMRLQTLVRILGESPNLREVSIKLPKIIDLDFDGTMVLDDPPARIKKLQIKFENTDTEIRVESSLLQIFSQLPLSSLNTFTIYSEENDPMAGPMESSNNLSSFIKTILTKCWRTLRTLALFRPYDWPEEPEAIPIEKEFKLEDLGLLWAGESRWLRSLIDAQRTRSGLESLIISCYEDFWVQGVVQEVALASKATLKMFGVDLHLKVNQTINEEPSLGFLGHLSKLEGFFIQSKRGFIESQGRRTLEEPLAPLVLPPTLKEVFLNAPITFQTLQSFCALPALEEITLEGFRWVDWPTLSVLLTELENVVAKDLTPSILLDWNWFKNLLINCPSLKSINFLGCVLDIKGIFENMSNILKKKRVLPGFDFDDDIRIHLVPLNNFPNAHLYSYTTSVQIDRSDLDRLIPMLKN